jgi:succinate-semialdehyde dehydrogenase/glutarate-semialdehyde dehydrogenase
MELGGNAPFIVFEDANIQKAVDGCIAAKFRNNGQTCVAANRIFVQRSIKEKFEKALYDKVSKMVIGDGFHEKAVCGPLINKSAIEKVVAHIEDAKKQGGKILVGGNIAESNSSNVIPKRHTGFYFEPTIISEAHSNMAAFREETFGPVATIYPFESEEEAIRLANNTNVGLAAYAYTQSIGRCHRLSNSLEYGMIALNQPSVSLANAPFGGIKESGFGREGGYLGLKDYLEHRTIHLNVD